MSDNAPLGSRPPSRIGTVLALLLVILIAAGAGLGAAYVMHKRPAAYRSSAALLIDQEPGLTLSPNDGVISKLIRLRLKYVDIAQTTTFSDAVAATTGLAPGRVHADVSASAAPAQRSSSPIRRRHSVTASRTTSSLCSWPWCAGFPDSTGRCGQEFSIRPWAAP